MPYATLISTAELAEHLDDPTWAIVDCRFSLADTERGRAGVRVEYTGATPYFKPGRKEPVLPKGYKFPPTAKKKG